MIIEMIGASHVRARTKFLTYIYLLFSYTLYIRITLFITYNNNYLTQYLLIHILLDIIIIINIF